MPDLSAYLNFSAVLDRSIPEIRLTDTSSYPAGVAAGLTGKVSITQPDGVTITGDFTDVVYSGGALTVAHKELRLATNYNFQKGVYAITYTVKHTSYTDTVKSQTFSINFVRPTADITAAFDVFTPSLFANDVTNYLVSGFTIASTVRSWLATITPSVGSIVGGNVASLDLMYSGNYYDGVYVITLNSTVSYSLNGFPNILLKDLLTVTSTFKTEKPPTLNTLYASLTAYKNSLDDLACSYDYAKTKESYEYATSLFQHLIWQGLCGSTTYLIASVDEFQKVLNNGVTPEYTPTGTVIPAYDFSAFCGAPVGGYSLPTASSVVKGGIKVGDGLTITGGVLSVTGGGGGGGGTITEYDA